VTESIGSVFRTPRITVLCNKVGLDVCDKWSIMTVLPRTFQSVLLVALSLPGLNVFECDISILTFVF
jgi:hypothetical protein